MQRAENASLRFSEAEKSATNAGWVDKHNWTHGSGIPDWEHQVSIMYPSVEYDEKDKKYKIWYHAFNRNSPVDEYAWTEHLIDKNNSKNVELGGFVNTAKGVINAGRDAICYMESYDGVNWVRPDLGEFYYQTREGEIIGTNIVFVGMHGIGVKKNENPDPTEPLYLIAGRTWETDSYDDWGGPVGVAMAYSEDGIHFEAPITIKTAYDCAEDLHYIRADTQNQLLWSAERGRYAVITRGYTKGEPTLRVVAYMESTDELKSIRDMLKIKREIGEKYWEKTAPYWTTPEMILDHDVTLGAQPYSMPVTHLAQGYYIGVVSVANFDKGGEGVWNSVHAELAWSRDAKEWHYINKGEPFIKNAEKFALEPGNDYGMIYCAAPVDVNGKTEIFYAATPELHYIEYDQIPDDIRAVVDEKIPKAKENKCATRTTTLSVIRIGKDRYAGIWSEDGSITTEAFEVVGENLKITADAADNGCLSVEILDSDGKTIEGYGTDYFAPVTESITDRSVFWKDKDLSELKGKTVSFKITLKNAGIYTVGGDIVLAN